MFRYGLRNSFLHLALVEPGRSRVNGLGTKPVDGIINRRDDNPGAIVNAYDLDAPDAILRLPLPKHEHANEFDHTVPFRASFQ